MEASSVLHQVVNRTVTFPKQQHQHEPPEQSEHHHPEKKMRPHQEQALRCPRCDSNNTKFCYYNNYSLSQPRYFCKSCRRYWTQGGTLRNVPVGGGCRKNKRVSTTSTKRSSHDQLPSPNPFLPTLPTPQVPYTFTSLNTTPPESTENDQLILNSSSSLSPCFLDILRCGSMENSYQSSYNGLWSGGGGVAYDQQMQFGEVGVDGSVRQEQCKGGVEMMMRMMGVQWHVGGEGEGGGRDLWTSGGVGSNWHGLINSTLM